MLEVVSRGAGVPKLAVKDVVIDFCDNQQKMYLGDQTQKNVNSELLKMRKATRNKLGSSAGFNHAMAFIMHLMAKTIILPRKPQNRWCGAITQL